MSIPLAQPWRVFSALALVFSILFGSLPLISGQAAAQAGKTINLQVIVDQSGSMAAATDTGVLRIDAAKRVLNEVIAQIPEAEGVNVGFRVYGHRGTNQPEGQAESCVSSDLLVPMQGVNKAALTAQVEALQPVGWTPLGYALQQAAADFTQPASDDVVNAIIMVTDGLETCGADPAAIAGELKSSPAGITTHVIGFGTKPEELTILEAITQASGGQLLGSNNAGQLMSALFEILEELEVVEETGTGETRNSPLGIGRIGHIGDYEVSVISVTPNANDIVLAANQFNEPPAEGNQFFMARIAVTYVGSSSGNPAHELNPQAVGVKSVSYTTFNNMCGYNDYPDNLILATELFQGGSGEYNICWQINTNDQNSLVMYIESNVVYNANPVWFSLGNPIEVTVDPDASVSLKEAALPTATMTTEPTPTAQTNTDSPENSRNAPAPVGQAVEVGDYEVTVLSVIPSASDAYSAVAYMEPAPAGEQFFIANISVTYMGDGSGTPTHDLDFQAVGNLSTSYSAAMNLCGVGDLTGHILLATELFAGGTGEYYVCWQIDSDDKDSLVMYVESWSRPNSDPAWFSLRP